MRARSLRRREGRVRGGLQQVPAHAVVRPMASDGGFAVCQPGEFSATGRGEGSARCPGCPLGKFSSTASATSCELTRCPLGLVPRAAARSAEGDCMSCPEGKWALLAHPNVCRVYCSAGRYQGVRDAPGTNCKACPAGKFQPRWGRWRWRTARRQAPRRSRTRTARWRLCPSASKSRPSTTRQRRRRHRKRRTLYHTEHTPRCHCSHQTLMNTKFTKRSSDRPTAQNV